MNKDIFKLMENKKKNEERNIINELYHTFWINTLKQFKENNEENGLYFWLQREKDNNNYVIFHHGANGLVEQKIKMNNSEKDLVIKRLANDGFKISETENNSILLTISKETIINFIEYKQKQKENHLAKMPITPFAETRRRK